MSNSPKVPDCNLSTDLGSLLEGGLFSDVTLAVGSQEFKAHKAVLAGTLGLRNGLSCCDWRGGGGKGALGGDGLLVDEKWRRIFFTLIGGRSIKKNVFLIVLWV